MTEGEEISTLAGLLDFYSDRADNFVNLLIAGVFGVFSLLILIYEVSPKNMILNLNLIVVFVLITIYYVLSILIWYCFRSYITYAGVSEKIRAILTSHKGTHLLPFPDKHSLYNDLKPKAKEIGDTWIKVELQDYIDLIFNKRKKGTLAKFRKMMIGKLGTFFFGIIMSILPWLLLFLNLPLPFSN